MLENFCVGPCIFSEFKSISGRLEYGKNKNNANNYENENEAETMYFDDIQYSA